MATKKPRTSPPGFRPTGRGLAVKLPELHPSDALATGFFYNRARSKKDGYLYKMPLLIAGVTTGYSVAGDYGQTSSSRTFYPKNYSQEPITISLLFANSFEYDKMVHFVRQHHWDALDTSVNDPNNGTHGTQSQPVEFRMFPYFVTAGRNRRGEVVFREIYGGIPGNFNAGNSNGTHVAGYIMQCAAGSERFQFFRTMDLQLKVSYDYLEDQVQGHSLTNKILENNYVNALATHLYGRKNGKVVPPTAVNPLGQTVQGNPPTDADSADTLWHNAKIAQITHDLG